MRIAVSEAKAQLNDLVRRAESGEDVVLTRRGRAAVRLTVVRDVLPPGERMPVLLAIMEEGGRLRGNIRIDPERSQDFLYGDDGMPA